MDVASMLLTVEWNHGVSVKYGDREALFDSSWNRHSCPEVFITHAHGDHSKGFRSRRSRKLSTVETKELVEAYGRKVDGWSPLCIGGRASMDDLEILAHNAGHVLGSSLYEIVTPEGTLLYTGDLQLEDSFTLKGAEPKVCDALVIESTFASKCFRFPSRESIAEAMIRWADRVRRSGKIPAFKADPLGNAQEVIFAFNEYTRTPVVVHWRVAEMSRVYNARGHQLNFLDFRSEEGRETVASGECVFIGPKNFRSTSDLDCEQALVSGWALWAGRGKTAFALSDHADFYQLTEFVRACRPKTVLTCFGGRFNQMFAEQIERELHIEARPLDLISTRFAF